MNHAVSICVQRKYRFASTVAIALFSLYFRSPCLATEPPVAEPSADAVIQHASRLIDDKMLVSIAVGIVDGDQTQTACFGQVALNDETPIDERTLFKIGSISKVFTGLLLSDAAVRGEVTLEQPLAELLDGVAQVPSYETAPIRLVHLATHTSGLPRLPQNHQLKNIFNPYADYDWQQLLAGIEEHKLRRAPGTEFEYSNWGMGLLGDALAHHLGKSYEELVVERICTPLGMRSTRITLSDDQKPRLAKGFSRLMGLPATEWNFATLAGAGGIRATLDDMLIFVRAQLQPEQTPLAEAIRLSQRTHYQPGSDKTLNAEMGLAWVIAEANDERWLIHDGMTGGYTAVIAIAPKRRFGIVVLSNTAAMEVLQVLKTAMRTTEKAKLEKPPAATK